MGLVGTEDCGGSDGSCALRHRAPRRVPRAALNCHKDIASATFVVRPRECSRPTPTSTYDERTWRISRGSAPCTSPDLLHLSGVGHATFLKVETCSDREKVVAFAVVVFPVVD